MKIRPGTMFTISAAVFVMILAAFLQPATAQTPVKLKYAITHGSPGLNPMGDVSVAWQKMVTERTKGGITFENYWGGALGAPAEHIGLMKSGMTDAGIIFGWYTPSLLPFSNFEYIFPFGPNSYEIATKAKKQIRAEIPEFNKEMQRQNVMIIADMPQTVYTFLSKDPLRTLEDFKGKKVGLIGKYFGRWLPPGASAVVRPGPDRYDMLKTGVVSVDLNPIENQFLFKLNEVTKYCMRGANILILANIPIAMNINTYKKLPPAWQKIIQETGRDMEELAYKEILPTWEKKIYASWEKQGMKFVDFPASEQKKWMDGLEDIPAEWAKEMEGLGLPGFQTVKRWQEITSSMGYKWQRQWGIKK